MSSVVVGIIGYGVVGSSVVKTIFDNSLTIKEKSGLDIVIKSVSSRSILEKSNSYLNRIPIKTADPYDIINDEEIDIVVEVIGGCSDAKDYVLGALENGKHVVTANKALLAEHSNEIFNAGLEKGLNIGFESAVAGGVPIIRVLQEDLAGNSISEIYGILNGTSNYILTKMEEERISFGQALSKAQDLGYAEADPSFDIHGIDSAHKIALLSSIAFGSLIPFEMIYTEGIAEVELIDIEFAKELDCCVKLLAIGKKYDDDLDIRVHPTMIPNSYMLASVKNVYNAVYLRGDKMGNSVSYGLGAGGDATSSAVVGDIVRIARDIKHCNSVRVPPLGFKKDYTYYYPIRDIKNIVSAYYLRFTVMDRPGALGLITSILGKHNVSISSAIQPGVSSTEESTSGGVPLVVMTHDSAGSSVIEAIAEIDDLDVIKAKTVIIRVIG